MQMCPASFWHEYSYSDFVRKSFFFFRNKDDEFKNGWEQTRRIFHGLFLVNGVKDAATDIMPFTWDKKARAKITKPMSQAEIDKTLNFYKQSGYLN